MAWLIGEIGKLLTKIYYLIPSHVRKSGNKLAHWLVNWGSWNRGKVIDNEGLDLLLPEDRDRLQQLLDVDKGGHGNSKENG